MRRMPTTRPRHTITETPPVEKALDELRAQLGDERIDLGELVVLGARAKTHKLREAGLEAVASRERLARMVRTRSLPVDPRVADEVKRLRLP